MKEVKTQYAVGRGEKIIGELRDSVGDAKDDLANVENNMHAASLEPDVHVLYVETTITTTRPRVYKEPTPEEAAAVQAGQTGEGQVLPVSGVWGGDVDAHAGAPTQVIVGDSDKK